MNRTATIARRLLARPEIVVGLAAGLAVAVRAFGSGLLLNVDLVIGDRIPIPPGQFGSGVELPRRVPFYTILAPLTWLFPGPTVAAAIIAGSVAGAVSGAARLAMEAGSDDLRDRQRFPAIALGLFYGLSPMMLTRAAVGHLPLMVATALLPWAVSSLRTHADRRGPWAWSLVWGSVFALTGSAGAVVGLVLLGAFMVREAPSVQRALGRLSLLTATQAIWLLPGLAVVSAGSALPTTDWRGFATRVADFSGEGSVSGALALVVGGGFFARAEDVARSGPNGLSRPEVTFLASLLVVLFVVGLTVAVKQRRWLGGGPLWLAGGLGLVLVVAPVLPGLWRLWDGLQAWPVFGLIREPQKFWPLFALVVVVVVGWVLARLPGRWAGPAVATVVTALTMVTAWPGLWGANGRLVVSDVPAGWTAVEDALEGQNGRLVVFPWKRYHFLDLSQGRNIIGPAPWLLTSFEGEFVTSGDPGFNDGGSERAERLEQDLAILDTEVRAARPIVPDLQALGVRWLLVEGSPDSGFYRRVGAEPDAAVRVDQDNFFLVEIRNYEEWGYLGNRPLGVAFGLVGALVTIGLGVSGWQAKRR